MERKNINRRNKVLFILIILVIIILLFIFYKYFLIPQRVYYKSRMITFVSNVQNHMVESKNSFDKIILENSNINNDIIFSSDGSGYGFIDYDSNKNYYIKMDKYGSFVKVVVYDDDFCYEANINDSHFEIYDVFINDVCYRENSDSYSGCTGKKIK